MRHFEYLYKLNVDELDRQLDMLPELWNENAERLRHPAFVGTGDIWLRYRDKSELKRPEDYNSPHWPVFYPSWSKLPALAPLVHDLMRLEEATHLGGILITKIPAGGLIDWHSDAGNWHAEHYPRKVYVVLKGNDGCVNWCEDESVAMARGEAWWFCNTVPHRVVNAGPTERRTLIVCMRQE